MTRKKVRRYNKSTQMSYDDLEQYGFGSWLKKSAGIIAPALGAVAGGLIAGPTGAMLGASLGGSTGGAIAGNAAADEAQAQQNAMNAQANAKNQAQGQLQALQANNQQLPMGTVARYGGRLRKHAKGGPLTNSSVPTTPTNPTPVYNDKGQIKGYAAAGWEGQPGFEQGFDPTLRPHTERGTALQNITRRNEQFGTPAKPGGIYRDVTTRDPEGIYNTKSYNEASFDSLKVANPALFRTNPNYAGLVGKRNGGVINYIGQSHEGPDGGIPVDGTGSVNLGQPNALVEGGEVGKNPGNGGETYIYSDKLEMRKGETFADAAKKIQSRYKLRMKNGKITDPISKKAFDKESKELEDNQEALKQAMEMTGGDVKMRTGGRIKMLRNFATGGGLPKYNDRGILNPLQSLPIPQINTPLPTGSQINSALQPGMPGMTGQAGTQDWGTYSGGSAGMAAAGMVAPILGNVISQIGANRRSKNRIKLDESGAAPVGISLERERASAREQANLARSNTRRVLKGGTSAQQYKANVGASEVGVQRVLGDQLGQSYQKEEMYNNQLPQGGPSEQAKLQAQMYNAQMANMENAQGQQRMNNVLNAINQGTAGYMRSKQDAALMQMMNPNVELQEQGPWYSRKYRTRERAR